MRSVWGVRREALAAPLQIVRVNQRVMFVFLGLCAVGVGILVSVAGKIIHLRSALPLFTTRVAVGCAC